MNKLLKLKPPQPLDRKQFSPESLEFSLEVIANVKSILISQLVSPNTPDINTMIDLANRAFTTLDSYGDEYESFYRVVWRFIKFHHERVLAEGVRNGVIKDRYEELVIDANNAKEAVESVELNLVKAKKKAVSIRQKVEETRYALMQLEEEMEKEESEVTALEIERERCCELHLSIENEVQRVGQELEEAEKMLNEPDQRKKDAIKGIGQTTTELRVFCQSHFFEKGK